MRFEKDSFISGEVSTSPRTFCRIAQPLDTQFRRLTHPVLHSGGRTAWSSVVDVEGNHYSARFWYDGSYQNNAREDAAEVAFSHLTGGATQNNQYNPYSR